MKSGFFLLSSKQDKASKSS